MKRYEARAQSSPRAMWNTSWLVVAVTLAAGHPGLARPGAGPAAPGAPDKAANAVSYPNKLNIFNGNSVITTTDKSSISNAAAAAAVAHVPSVNERFPSAVLFGRTCGGTIISPTWVITAGHCTLFRSGSIVLAGTSSSDSGGVKARIKRLVIHPQFTVGPYWLDPATYNIKQVPARYDFLLAELETPLPLNGKTITSATLDDQLTWPAGVDVGYAGYGAAEHGETMRDEMHAMELATLADEECQRQLEQFDARDMLCTKGKPPRFDSACNGDSGSGLISAGRLLGVASWVQDDATTCQPGKIVVFSRVASVRSWIKAVTGV